MNSNKKRIVTINLPEEVYNKLDDIAFRKQMHPTQYLKRLLDLIPVESGDTYVEIADEETEKRIAEAYEDYEKGNYVRFNPWNEEELKEA